MTEGFGDGFELGGSGGVGVAVGELVDAREDSVLEFTCCGGLVCRVFCKGSHCWLKL